MARTPEEPIVIVDEQAPGFIKAQVKRIFWGVPAPPALSHLFRVPLTRSELSLRFTRDQAEAIGSIASHSSHQTHVLDAGFADVSGRLANLESLTSTHIAIDLAQLQTASAIHGSIEQGFGNLQAISVEIAGLIADLSVRIDSGLGDISDALRNSFHKDCKQRIQEGLGNLTMGKWDMAKACFEKAINEWSLDPLAHYNLGLCAINDGDYEAAEQHLRDALQIVQMNGDVLNASNVRRTLARLYRSMQEAGSIVPPGSDQELHLNHVEAKQKHDKNLNAAIEELSSAVRKNPALYEEQMSLICALIDGGHANRATAEFSNLVFKKPEYRDRVSKTSAGKKLRELFPNLFNPKLELSDCDELFTAIRTDLDALNNESVADLVVKESAKNLLKIADRPDSYQPEFIVRAIQLYYASGNKLDAMKAFAVAYMTNYKIKNDDGTRDHLNLRNRDFERAFRRISVGDFFEKCLPATHPFFMFSLTPTDVPITLIKDFEAAGYIEDATRLASNYIADMLESEMDPYDSSSRQDLLYAIWRSGDYQLFVSKLNNYVLNETLSRHSKHKLSSRVFLSHPSITEDPYMYQPYGGIFENVPSEVIMARVNTLLNNGQVSEANELFERSLVLIHKRKEHFKVYPLVKEFRDLGLINLFEQFVQESIPWVAKYEESHFKAWFLVRLHLDNGDMESAKKLFYMYADKYYYHLSSSAEQQKDEQPDIAEIHEEYKRSTRNLLRILIAIIKAPF